MKQVQILLILYELYILIRGVVMPIKILQYGFAATAIDLM